MYMDTRTLIHAHIHMDTHTHISTHKYTCMHILPPAPQHTDAHTVQAYVLTASDAVKRSRQRSVLETNEKKKALVPASLSPCLMWQDTRVPMQVL